MKGEVAGPEVLVVGRVDEVAVGFTQVYQILSFHR